MMWLKPCDDDDDDDDDDGDDDDGDDDADDDAETQNSDCEDYNAFCAVVYYGGC